MTTQTTQMKAIFYDPYIDTIGGGERYTFTLADYLLKKNWDVVIFDGNRDAVNKLKDRFNLDLESAELITLPQSAFKDGK
jgi:6-phosphogluconate dehydrogenase (decarboxylating)